MQVLALDLSINQTGWAISPNLYGHLKPDRKDPTYYKIRYNLRNILNLIYDNDIREVVIEDIASIPNRGAAAMLCEQQGIIKYHLMLEKIPFTLVNVLTLKKFITGSGHAQKKDMIQAVNTLYNLNLTNDNEADALALLHYFYNMYKF